MPEGSERLIRKQPHWPRLTPRRLPSQTRGRIPHLFHATQLLQFKKYIVDFHSSRKLTFTFCIRYPFHLEGTIKFPHQFVQLSFSLKIKVTSHQHGTWSFKVATQF